MKRLASSIKYFYRENRKAKCYRIPHYEAVPYYMRPMHRDEHDYKLRSVQEVQKDIDNMEFSYETKYSLHANNRYPFDDNDSKVVGYLNLSTITLTKMQKKRMILLLGPRYKGSDRVTIACDIYPDYEQNAAKLDEMIQELLIESLRAP